VPEAQGSNSSDTTTVLQLELKERSTTPADKKMPFLLKATATWAAGSGRGQLVSKFQSGESSVLCGGV